MISLRNVTLRRGSKVLLQKANWTIYPKQRIGLIGENGAGKTSLFSLLLSEQKIDEGDIDIPKQLRFGHVAQEIPSTHQSALNFVLDGDVVFRETEKALTEAEQAHDGLKIAALHEKMSDIDAYTAPTRAAQLLSGLGFDHEEQRKEARHFSGGWRVRLNLAKALMAPSDVLLLDEPTNHLDLDAVIWLTEWLKQYRGTLILISHDRDFLDETVLHIVHLTQQQLQTYTGNYSSFEKERAQKMLLQQATYERQQKKLAHLQSFVNRFRAKASKATQAQSRLKAIERMELVCAIQAESPFQFEFKPPRATSNPLIWIDDAKIAYDQKIILDHLQLSIAPKERIALIGPNGAGKSSLIKLLAGEIEPKSGIRQVSANLVIGYFAQHQIEALNLNETPIFHIKACLPQLSETELRTYLGSFGFSGNTVYAKIAHFSGGEKSRLALALLVAKRPNLLLLDEPTNHLDLEMRSALSLALQDYEGAMILVTHDRFLVRTTTDKLLLVAEGKVEEFEGDLNDYQQWLTQFRKQSTIKNNADAFSQNKKEKRKSEAKSREAKKLLADTVKQLEKKCAQLQAKLSEIQQTLTDTALYDAVNKNRLQELLLNEANLKKELTQAEEAWLAASDELNSLDSE